jgi:hypothetical protein
MSANRGIVSASFEHQHQAEQAVAELWKAGFAPDRVDMVSRSQGVTEGTPNFTVQKDASQGAVYGALGGAGTGLVAGTLAVLLIPGLGTVLAGGLMGGLLGAAGGSFLGVFSALAGDETAERLHREVESGRLVVLVRAFDRADEAQAILSGAGGRLLHHATDTAARH